ncbi:hypothetical protein DVH24_019645 [Malus domestica]|uniref:Uncharacterized protein n=1 Tax=Malus domestica TaxID=3750 RepID=A0A498I4A2_MALDO|nr:hypothetical protein DVH24_019645 [Malus domestica]
MGHRALAAVGMLATTNTTTKAMRIVEIMRTRIWWGRGRRWVKEVKGEEYEGSGKRRGRDREREKEEGGKPPCKPIASSRPMVLSCSIDD